MLQQRSRIQDGRWFLTTSFAILGKPIEENQRIERQARLLLQRYGILVKEWYRREQGLLAWYNLFQVLKPFSFSGSVSTYLAINSKQASRIFKTALPPQTGKPDRNSSNQ